MALSNFIGSSVAGGCLLISLTAANGAQALNFKGSTYSLTTLDNWTGAQAQAVVAGGNLVTINDAEEQAFLVSTFGGSELLWIGLNDIATEGTFQWVSGQPVTYTNWYEPSGEPNNSHNEDWTIMNWVFPGQWNDYYPLDIPDYMGERYRGIIEVSTPEPTSTLSLLALGTLGAASTLKRKLKPSKPTTKELEKVG
jgi:hypothetical protein